MNNEDLYDGITEIHDDLIDKSDGKTASGSRTKRRRWVSAVAAMLAAVLLVGAALRPGAGGGGTTANAYAIAQAEYPEYPPYPNEEAFMDPKTGDWDGDRFEQVYEPWWEAQRSRWWDLPEDYAAGMEDFFAGSIRQFLSGGEGENRVYSPVNLCMALAMQAELTDGNSRRQILDLLGQDSVETLRTQIGYMWKANYVDDGATTSVLANSLWLNQDVEFVPETMETLAQNYYASSFRGEMGSEGFNQALRDWINRQTGGLLEEQAAELELDPSTVLALASTVYFRAKWSGEFQESRTEPGTFHAPDGDVTCDFMNQYGGGSGYYWGERFSATSKYLENNAGEMWFLLPDEGTAPEELLEDPQVMEFLLMKNKREGWENQTEVVVNLSVPKFDVSSDLDLREGLRALGITDIFDPAVSDFSPMTDQVESVFVSQAKHAARVAVDEEGVIAAAFTVMADAGAGMPPEDEVDFVLDRPFLFVITGVDGLPLFAGMVNRPV